MSITASCSVVDQYGAICIGLGASIVYTVASRTLHRIPCYGVDGTFGTGTIDDVIDAIPVHGCVPINKKFANKFYSVSSNQRNHLNIFSGV